MQSSCLICEKSVAKEDLVDHFRVSHNIITDFAMKRLLQLSGQPRLMKNPTFDCDYCAFKHAKKSEVTKHVKLMHPSKARKQPDDKGMTQPSKTRKKPEVKLVWKTLVDEMDPNKESFMPGDIVQGQLKGSPWWPGMIQEVDQSLGRYSILFFKPKKTCVSWIGFSQVQKYQSDVNPNEAAKLTKTSLNQLEGSRHWAEYAKNWTAEQTFNYFVHKTHP